MTPGTNLVIGSHLLLACFRATTALKLRFEVCKELRNHLELLPKTGYIQAQSQFSAQLKFLPRKSLYDEAGKYFDRETGVLEAPMTIRVANQTRPVPFTVHAVVTNSGTNHTDALTSGSSNRKLFM